MLEALAAGKPLIVTQGGGLVELVEEEINGYSVPVRDPVALANALFPLFCPATLHTRSNGRGKPSSGKRTFCLADDRKKAHGPLSAIGRGSASDSSKLKMQMAPNHMRPLCGNDKDVRVTSCVLCAILNAVARHGEPYFLETFLTL